MITVISGTNRRDSMTLRVAKLYYAMLKEKHDDVQLLSLEQLKVWERGEELLKVEKELLIPTQKFVFVMPEYNGSFPGILKTMIDNSDIKKCWWHKKAMMAGVADGRAGNLRGMEHMTNILHYPKMNVLYNKVPISRINDEVSKEGVILKPATEQVIKEQIEEFLVF